MAVAIRIISASGEIRTVTIEPGTEITLEPGDTVVLLPDAETAIATSQDGDNLVIETDGGNIVLAAFFTDSPTPEAPRARSFGAAAATDEGGLQSALVFQDGSGLQMITPTSTTTSGSYTLPHYEGLSLPESGVLPEGYDSSSAEARESSLSTLFALTPTDGVYKRSGDGSDPLNLDDSVQQAAASSGDGQSGNTVTNTAPAATNLNGSVTYIEDAVAVALAPIVISDADAGDTVTATLTLANAATGAISSTSGGTYNAATGVWTISGSVASVNNALANVSFTPAANNATATTIRTHIEDAAGTGPADGTITLNVTPVNDAPAATNLSSAVNYTEGAASVALTDIVVSDVDAGDTITATLTLADPTTGALTTPGAATYDAGTGIWTISASLAAVNAALAAVNFVPAANNDVGTTINTHIEDAAGAGPVDGTITLNVTPVNDAPSATNLTQATFFAPGAGLVPLADITVTDPDTGDLITATLTVANPAEGSLTATSGNGETYTPGTGVWTITGTVSAVNAALAAVSYQRTLDATNSITTHIEDAAGTGPADGVITLDTNDTPTATNLTDTVLYNEGDASVDLANIVVTDPDVGDVITATLTLANTAVGVLTATSGNGETYTAGTGVWTISGSVAAVNAALAAVTFIPATENDVDTTIATHIEDGLGVGPADGVITLDAIPVNDPPTATNLTNTVAYNEGTPSVNLPDIVVTDVDTGDMITATLTLANPTTGALTASSGNGETYTAGTGVWTITATLAAVNAALAAVAFAPATDNDLDTTISTHIEDTAGSGPADGTISLNVTAVNDAPSATNLTDTATYNEGDASVALTDIVVSDVDTGEMITATLTLANTATGTLTASSGNGETYTAGTGVWTITGTLAAVNAALAAVAFVPGATNDADTTITTHIEDAAGTGPADGTITLDVTPINDPPTATNLTSTSTYTEGDATVALDDIVVTDPDTADVITATLTLANTSAGSLTAASGNGETYTAGTGVWTVTGSVTAVNAALAAVAFVPATDTDVDTTITTHIEDMAGTGPADGSITLDVTAVNDAPTATNLTQAKFFAPGAMSAALDDIAVTDVDTGEMITATLAVANTSEGSLTATSGNGETYTAGTGVWTITGTLAAVNAALAAVAYVPTLDADNSITTHIEDAAGTGPADGVITLDTNDIPMATNLTQTQPYTEGAATVALDDIVITDPDVGDTLTATLTLANTAAGTLTASSGNGETYTAGTGVWTVTGSVAAVNAALAAVSFVPATNNDVNTTITTHIEDALGTGPADGTISLNVTPVNDAPGATNLTDTVAYTEGDASVALADIVVSDVDTGETITATLTLANPAAGALTASSGNGETYTAGTGVWTVTGTVAAVNAALAAAAFVPATNNDVNTTITTHIEDAAGAGPADGSIALNVTAVNDAPTATNLTDTVAYTEGDASVALSDIVVSDVDTGETITATLTLANPVTGALSASSGNGETYTAGTGVWTVTGTVAAVNAALAAAAFVPATNNDVNTTITTHIEDAAGTGPADGTISLNVTAVNDAPSATNLTDTVGYTEGDASVALSDIVVSDVDTGETITATLTLANTATGTLTATSGNGETYTAGTGVWTITGTLAAVNAALAAVAFVPTTNNDVNTTITTHIEDAMGAGPADGAISLNVTAVNDAPSATNLTDTATYNEGDASVALTDIVVSDVDTGEMITATLTLANTATGTLTASSGNGETYTAGTGVWTITGTLAAVNAALAAVAFVPGATNDADTTITTHIEDAAGTGPADGTITLDVTPINDPPTATNLTSTSTYTEGDATVALDDIVVTDPDTADVITATLTLANTSAGSLTAASGNGETYTAGTGVWTVTGSVTAVNAALAAVAFVPATDTDVDTTITTHIEDMAGTGPADGSITLDVTAVNDAPTATNLTQAKFFAAGAMSVALDDVAVTDVDTGEMITATLTVANTSEGSLTATSGNGETYTAGTGVWTITGTLAAVNAALAAVAYVPTLDADNSITTHIEDAAGSGPADGVITLDTNDIPMATNLTQTQPYTEGAATVALDDIVITDPDVGDTLTATLTLANTAAGSLTASSGNGETYTAGTGVWTVTGSVAAVNAALAAVSFVPATNNDVNTTITTHIEDALGTGPADGTISLNVTPVNDAPGATNLTDTVAYTEGAASVALSDIVVSDVDTGETITATLTLANPAAGALTASSGNGETYTAGTGVWTVTGTVAAVNAALAAAAFVPAMNNDVNTTITTHIEDAAGAGPADGSIALNVTAVNDAPTATNLTDTVAYNEDDASVPLTDIVVSDVDTGETITATLTLANPATGALSASSGNGETYTAGTGVWTVTGTVAAVNAALAAATFVPAANNETDTTITTHIEDAAGAGPADGSITLDVTALNDAPTATNLTHARAYTEGAASVNLANIVVSDVDAGDTITATLTLADTAAGTLTATSGNGETYTAGTGVWTVTGSVAAVNAALTGVSFVPATNNDVNTTITTHIEDAAGAGPADGTISLNVSPVNDAPSATNLTDTATYNEGDASVALTDIVVSDVDTGETITATLTLANTATGTLSASSGNGETYTAGTGVWTITGTLAAVNAALAAVAFVPATDNDLDTTITTHIEDAAGTGPADGTITLDVTPVNDAPTATNLTDTVPYTEGDASVALMDIAVSDVDTGETITATLTLANTAAGALTATSGNGETYTAGTGVWTVTGSVTAVNAALAAVAFVPATDTDVDTTITTHIEDAAGAGPADGSITLDVTPVNDAPTATNLTQAKFFAAGAMSVALDDVAVTDVDTGEMITATLTVANTSEGSLTATSGNGETYTAGTGVWTITGTLAAVNAALAAVAYVPTLDADNSITTHIEDAAGSGPADGVITLDTNDIPMATNLTQTQPYTEGAATVALDDIVITDPDVGDTLTATLTLANTAAGTLTASSGNGETYTAGTGVWTVTGSVAAVNAALAAAAFVPATNNDVNTTITTHIEDALGTGPADGTISLNVTPVNDAPGATNLTDTVAYTEGDASVALADIVVSDVDTGETITATLTLANPAAGALTASSGNGETYTAGTGVWTVTGTVAAVNAALAAVSFVPATNNDVNTTITTHIEDALGTGPADGTISLNVTPVNDAPGATNLTDTVAYTEGAASVALSDIVVSDVDTGETITATLTLANTAAGALTATSGNGETYTAGTGVWTVTGTVAAVNAALVAAAFVPATNNDVNTTITTHIEDAAGTGPADGTISLNVTAVNDAPSATNLTDTVGYTEGDASVALSDIVVSDVDTGETITATLTLADTATGALTATSGNGETYTAGTGVWTVTGTLAAVNAALAAVAFVPTTNNDVNTTITTHIEDAMGTGPADGAISLNVTAVNDAPSATNLTNTATYNEGDASVALTDIVVSDVDTGEMITATLTLANTATGTLTASSGNGETYTAGTGVWTITGTLAAVNAALAAVAFVPGATNDADTTITTHIEDTAGTGPADGTITLDVTPINDVPTATELTNTRPYTEGDATVALNNIVVTDPDTGDVITATLTLANTSAGSLTAASGNGETYTAGTGVWTVSGSVAAVNAALAAVAFVPTTQNDVDTTITTHIEDMAGTGPADGSITLDVTAVNDAPTATNLTQSQTFAAGAMSVALDDVAVTDVDTGEMITATLTVANTSEGSLTAASGNGETYTAGTGVWTITGTLAAVNAALAAVAYVPTLDADNTITTHIEDAAGSGPADGVITLDTNDIPMATNLTQTQPYTEGDASVPLDDIVITDPDVGDTLTATLTLANTAAGSLTASSGNGETYTAGTGVWTVTGSVAVVNAALAAVSFVPATNNDVNTTITTHIEDALGTGPADGTISLNVTPVNDAPGATNLTDTVAYTEGAASVALSDIVVSDVDTGETITATLTLANTAAGALTATSGNGETYTAGTGVWTVTGTVAAVNAALAAVEFIPLTNNDVDTTITTHIEDAAGAGPADGTITLDVTPVNDTPSATNLTDTVAYTEGDAAVALNDIVVTDVDTGETITARLTLADPATGALSASSGNGETYTAGTGIWTITGSLAAVNAALAAVSFVPTTNNDIDTTVATHIEDAPGASPSDGTITLDVTPVNDAPSATNLTNTRAYTEGDSGVDLQNIVVSDVDTNDMITATLTLANTATGSLTATSGNGETYTSGTGVWTITGTLAAVNAALASVEFVPTTNNDIDTTIATHIEDAAGAGPADGTITLDVNPVNDTPSATNLTNTRSYTEGAASVALNNIVVSDVDTGETITARLTLADTSTGSLTATSGNGETYTAGTGIWTVTGSLAAVNAALAAVAFVPTTNNDIDTTITTHIEDAAGASPADGTITLDVTPVNDAPTATNLTDTVAYTEGDASVALADIVVTDVDTVETITATLTLADTSTGVLSATSGNGETYTAGTGVWTISGTTIAVNAALAAVAFIPATDNDVDTTIATHIEDAAGAGPADGTITLDVTPVNDAPVNTVPGATLSGTVSTTLFITSVVSVADVDEEIGVGPNTQVTLDASDNNATITVDLSGDSGATVSDNGTDLVTVSGTLAQINAALEDMSYLNGFSGAQSIVVTTDDMFSGGALTDADTININLSVPSMPPSIDFDNAGVGTQSVDEDTALVFNSTHNGGAVNGFLISDPDSTTTTVTLTVSNGQLTLNGTAGLSGSADLDGSDGTLNITGTLDAVNDALDMLQYQGNPNYFGSDSLAITASDSGGNMDSAVINITVDPINDAPVIPGGAMFSSLSAIDETDTSIPSGSDGIAVRDLIVLGTNITDAETTNESNIAIAISDADISLGSWWYTINGSTWQPFADTDGDPAVSNSAALVLDGDSNNRIYFRPNNSGGGTATITFHASDKTDGTDDGELANVSTTGGATAFSTATGTVSITINGAGGGSPQAVFQANTLDGSNGFDVYGTNGGDRAGDTVYAVGDFNGDGLGDILIGAPFDDDGSTIRGQTSVIFGRTNASVLHDVTLGSQNGTTGFELDSNIDEGQSGLALGSGDTDGDGLIDLFVGTPGRVPVVGGLGTVVLGTTSGAGSLDDANVQNFNPNSGSFPANGGYIVEGPTFASGGSAQQVFGGLARSIGSGGDFNGDGFEDLVLGAPNIDPSGAATSSNRGQAYVLFGKASPSNISPADPPNGNNQPVDHTLGDSGDTTGFNVDGGADLDLAGSRVSFAGDVDGDGFDDLLVSSPNANGGDGEVYLVYGRADLSADDLDLTGASMANGTDGVIYTGVDADGQLGNSALTGVGDLNGDGLADFAFTAPRAQTDPGNQDALEPGRTYVIFGSTNRTALNAVTLGGLDGTDGFMLEVDALQDLVPGFVGPNYQGEMVVGGAGDVNGDGFDDLLVGIPSKVNGFSGQVYLVYGHGGSFAAENGLNLRTGLDGSNGMVIIGNEASNVFRQFGGSVSGGIDFNGDGFEDIVIGAANDNVNGSGSGTVSVIFGANFNAASTTPETLTASGNNQSLVGGAGNDTLSAASNNNITLRGGRGDDTLRMQGDELNLRIDAGTGTDVLEILGSGQTLDLTAIPNNRIENLEQIDLTGSGNNTLRLDVLDVLALSETSNVLEVFGNAGDALVASASTGGAWVDGGAVGGVRTYTLGQATLLVDEAINQAGIVV